LRKTRRSIKCLSSCFIDHQSRENNFGFGRRWCWV